MFLVPPGVWCCVTFNSIFFYKVLQVNTALVKLELEWNNISDHGLRGLAQVLTTDNSTIAFLAVGDHFAQTAAGIEEKLNIGNDGAAAIAEMLKFNKSLVDLNLHGNKIDNVGAASIGAGIMVWCPSVSWLICISESITRETQKYISQAACFYAATG
jgi:hypothetical protein